jgi:putative oxidoreductase
MKTFIELAARFLFGLVFIYAGATKIADPAGFATDIFQYQILPDTFIYPAALFLPWLEAVCGLCLWAGAFTRGAAAVLNTLLVVFMLALGLSIWRGTDVDCGCFGSGGSTGAREALIRAGITLARGIVVQVFAGRANPPRPTVQTSPKPSVPEPEPVEPKTESESGEKPLL